MQIYKQTWGTEKVLGPLLPEGIHITVNVFFFILTPEPWKLMPVLQHWVAVVTLSLYFAVPFFL
jgi:hypothetical protein